MNCQAKHVRVELAPLPIRLRNWFAVLAIFAGLLAQTVHTHKVSASEFTNTDGHALITAAADQNADVCPLCVSMHSANPAPTTGSAIVSTVVSLVSITATEQIASLTLSYFQFSRPPPNSSR